MRSAISRITCANGRTATSRLTFSIIIINYSNICILSCQFCAFARRPHEKEGQFTYDIDEMARQTKVMYDKGITEVHIVGGLHPKLPFDYYIEMIQGAQGGVSRSRGEGFYRDRNPASLRAHREEAAPRDAGDFAREWDSIRSLAAARRFSIPRCATRFAAARKARRNGSRSIARGTRWGSVAPAQCSTATSRRPRNGSITCAACANLQDETHGFTAIVPFAYEPENNKLTHLGLGRASAFEDLRNLAIARLYLDNFDHVTAYWVSLGLPTAQIALSFGVDDLHGTIQQEKIFHMAGSQTPQGQTVAKLEHAIREAGRVPMQRNTFYEKINARQIDGTILPDAPAQAEVTV